jgi:hypothetical protein
MRVILGVVMVLGAASCAASRLPDARGLDVIVKPRTPLTADARGAEALQSATQCDAEFVRVLSTGAMLVRLWPTTAAPDVKTCLQKVKALPGVEYAEADAPMKTRQ